MTSTVSGRTPSVSGARHLLERHWPLFLAWGVSFALVLRSRPFLRLPYDMWHHLMLIRGWFQDGAPFLLRPGTTYHEVGWHWFWAQLFRLLNISDVFLWAKIIHCSQFLWALVCAYFFSATVLRLVFGEMSQVARLFGLLSAWLFIVGVGTFSVQYQLAWILWYGVNYQGFTLPAYFLGAALAAQVWLLPSLSQTGILWRSFCYILVLVTILALHPLEGLYLLFASLFLVMVSPFRLWTLLKERPIIVGSVIVLASCSPFLLVLLPKLGVALPQNRALDLVFSPVEFWNAVVSAGRWELAHSMFRIVPSLSELALFGTLLLAVCFFWMWRTRTPTHREGKQTVAWLLVCGLFLGLAQRTTLGAGLMAVLSGPSYPYRFAYASPWFVSFGLLSLFLMRHQKMASAALAIVIMLAVVPLLSRFVWHGVTNANIASVWRSLELREKDSVGIQYPLELLRQLDAQVLAAPPPPPGKSNIFLVRSDLLPYLRAATGAYVVGDRLNPASREVFAAMPDNANYQLVEIRLPKDFPLDESLRIFSSMNL